MIDFLCIGAQKAGTTWLMANLGSHPDVWTPPFVKELHYFDTVHLGFGKSWVLKTYRKKGDTLFGEGHPQRAYFQKVADKKSAFTDEWYGHVFSPAPGGALRGECTPLYCALNPEGVEHVARLAPRVRIIYIIRDPHERMLSSCRMIMARRQISEETEIQKLLDDVLFIRRGDYRGNIPRWEGRFPDNQMLFLPFGDIRNDPAGLMRRVEEHLGLAPFHNYPKLSSTVHRTKVRHAPVSPGFLQRIREICQPQNDYLLERFGPDFLARTR